MNTSHKRQIRLHMYWDFFLEKSPYIQQEYKAIYKYEQKGTKPDSHVSGV